MLVVKLIRAFVMLVPSLAFALWSGNALMRTRTPGARLRFTGAMCLVVVVFTHIAEGLNAFAFRDWGQSQSASHYLDLFSAIAGVTQTLYGLFSLRVSGRVSAIDALRVLLPHPHCLRLWLQHAVPSHQCTGDGHGCCH